jgi:hypothetical protein
MSSSLYGVPYEEIVEEREAREIDIDSLPREDDIGRDKLETVERSVELWEARSGTTLPERNVEDVGVIRLTLDPVRVLSRPLSLYCLIWVAQQLYRRMLCCWGFEEQIHGGLLYFVRTPKGWSADRTCEEGKRPLVFLHGLGVGPVQCELLSLTSSMLQVLTSPLLQLQMRPSSTGSQRMRLTRTARSPSSFSPISP